METLNMQKGQSIDLKKEDGSAVAKVRVGLAWDVADGISMDLDLFVVRMSDKKVAYFNARAALQGIFLSEDNVTGDGEGDDEYVIVDAKECKDGKYVVCLNIYNAKEKGQSFAKVKNAVCTVYNHESGEVIAKFNITSDGAENSALVVAEVADVGEFLQFTARGDYVNGNIQEVVNTL